MYYSIFIHLPSEGHPWLFWWLWIKLGFPGSASDKESPYQCKRLKRCRFDPWVKKIPWRRVWQPTPVFFPGESHGLRGLEGYSPWGCKKSWTQLKQLRTCSHNEHRSANISFRFWFVILADSPEVGLLGHMVVLFFIFLRIHDTVFHSHCST